MFALAVQFSDFRAVRYYLPAYPFLFFLAAHSLARCQDRFPRVQWQIQTAFLASVVVLGLGTHAPLLSLDRPGAAFSAKGYSYALLPETYLDTHAPAGPDYREFFLEQVQRPFLSDILPKLPSDDQRDLSRRIVLLLADAAPLNGLPEDFARIERLVPPGFDRYFYYQLGVTAIRRPPNELPKAVAAVEFLRHRSTAAHYLAVIGIYRQWPKRAAVDRTPESLIKTPATVAPELLPHYWRAIGYLTGRSWYTKDRSLSLWLSSLTARVQAFVPRLDPSVQRSFLQGIGELLFDNRFIDSQWVVPAELERVPPAYQEGLLEGWGMALGEDEIYSLFPGKGQESPYWTVWTKGFSAKSLVSIREGKAQFEALFEGPAPSAVEPPRSQ